MLNTNRTVQSIWLLLLIGICPNLFGQIVDGNAYMIGEYVEIAIHGNAGHEGTADWAGHHSRGGFEDAPFGFVANPQLDGWVNYDGDFFTPGSPENGFGMEINGTNYSNNAWDSDAIAVFLNEIPTAPGGAITHSVESGCITVEWEGVVSGVTINVKYHLSEFARFYTTEITMTNNTGSDLTDLYYYRNLDPDNNQPLTANFATTNKIVSQVTPECIKAQVSAEQATPWDSYLGFGALGENFRVSHGGFSNRSGSDIWNAAWPLHGDEGDEETGDYAISLAYKTDLAAGESVNFTYAIVLDYTAVEEAFSSLYFINYTTSEGDVGGGETGSCIPVVIINTCLGHSVTLNIDGPNIDMYDWTWIPTYEENDTIEVWPDIAEVYTVVGVPTMPCLTGIIEKSVSILFTEGPFVSYTDPGPVCEEFSLDTLDIIYEGDHGENVNCIYLTEQPDSATQVEPEFEGPVITEDDEVWLMCGDTVTGCYDFVKIDLDFIGPGLAGPDSTITVCNGPGSFLDLHIMIADTANHNGEFDELTDSGAFIDTLGILYTSGLIDTFVFAYFIEGIGTCPSDTAIFTVIVKPSPHAFYHYDVLGVSSADGLNSTCIVNTVNFTNLSTIDDPGVITELLWAFGDGETSTEENPSHTYEFPGVYGITLVITGDNGCTSTFYRLITIYLEPPMEIIFTDPTCFGSNDGTIIVEVDENIGAFTLLITNEDGDVLNVDGGGIVTGLDEGVYYIDVVDASGCSASYEIVLTEPPLLDIYLHIVNPACLGDSGHVVVDSVIGESLNNPIYYEWEPNPAGIEGFEADSSYWMVAGDYSVTVTDSKGCTNSLDFTLIDPPLFYFTEWGWDTAYCRLYNFQSGNGYVYAAAAGGLPNYVYEWTYLVDGSTSNSTTWGGRNPGDHLITVTDAGGCVLQKIVTVDSVNPIASFTTESAFLNENCAGTADVEVEFTNTSQYYANPNNPISDTLFLWDMDRTEEIDWLISTSVYEKFDTIYKARGYTYEVNVCLIAFNKNGCSDTACKLITIYEPPELSAPNIFSPNNNGVNDLFTFDNLAKGIRDFHCIIIDRWGVQVGEINHIDQGWDGINYGGKQCPDGTYFYSYTAVADNEEEFSGHGTVTLIGSERD